MLPHSVANHSKNFILQQCKERRERILEIVVVPTTLAPVFTPFCRVDSPSICIFGIQINIFTVFTPFYWVESLSISIFVIQINSYTVFTPFLLGQQSIHQYIRHSKQYFYRFYGFTHLYWVSILLARFARNVVKWNLFEVIFKLFNDIQ